MTQPNLTVYEQAVTTHRSAELLARMHGFESVEDLAKRLAPNAQVLDAGAGASPFGNEVAALRPDITWTNFDYSYRDPKILAEVTAGAPENVKHIAGDATHLQGEPGTYDVVFSYWLLPHLSIDDPEAALKAAKGFYDVAKPGALISVGPDMSNGHAINLRARPAVQFYKDARNPSRDNFAQAASALTKLPPSTRAFQKLANEVATPFFGTSRYVTQPGKIPHVLHPQSGEYVSPFSRKGAATAARLAVAASKHIANQNKDKLPSAHNTAAAAGTVALGAALARKVVKRSRK
ncbi:MAG: putative methyltransferase [Candidatus Saccharibacteria bacterium]|nr:putative methyltransferase [Candidatus Saccharibacteria bacterium]